MAGRCSRIAVASSSTSRSADTDPDDPIARWHALARRTLIAVGIFSVFVNLLMMTLPLYLFQLSDRVLTSRSLDTLVMLTIVAVGFLCILALLDALRRQVLGRLATNFETILGGPVLASIVTTAKVADFDQHAGVAQPAPGQELHRQPGDAAAVRCAAGAALLRRDLPHSSRPRLDRTDLRPAADRHRAAQSAGDATASGRSRPERGRKQTPMPRR